MSGKQIEVIVKMLRWILPDASTEIRSDGSILIHVNEKLDEPKEAGLESEVRDEA